jgi:isoleucyl-tRNA synthetase
MQGSKMNEKKSFKETLNLPKTEFSIRANAKTKEPELLARWIKEGLYEKAKEKGDKKKFTLHDGPPFANGHMHIGHALNRTLKDITCKIKRMSGYRVVNVPGWDCHGLPIELKVLQEIGGDKTKISPIEFKKKCRAYAQKWIDIQKEEVMRLGVVTDWDKPYFTMSPAYESGILKSLATFVEKGYIERKEKTVPWCASCKSVLAIAEIEHKGRKDPSCYILFPLADNNSKTNLLVWTTTPWTIPLNRAVVLHPTAQYVVLQGRSDDEEIIVGEKLADEICSKAGIEKKVLREILPSDLEGQFALHPYIKDLKVPIILDDMVLLDDGTACVHSAPGCGPEDYVLGIKHNLEIFSTLSSDGKYTKGIKPVELEGMSVVDGQIWSIKKMHEKGKLFHKESMTHAYPHCWRCHQPLIFRATEQWFCDLKKNNLVDRAIEVADKLKFVPEWGNKRLSSSIASRAEWCISRQRPWGVPIPAILCKKCGHAHLDKKFIEMVAQGIEKEGVEYWDRVEIEEVAKGFTCPSCGNNDLREIKKEMDILDVWFESGVSHTAVQERHPELQIPADVYLEGSDQHRGWFQSSLLSSVIMYDKACTKSFVTHAFVLDEKAQKMSKSKGNVVSPQKVIERYSADILRLWVAASNFEDDVIISEKILKNVAEVYRKIRNTCRFMISNLYDFDIRRDAVPFEELHLLDVYALSRLQEVVSTVKKSYNDYWFTNVFRTLNRYCTNDLSAFYLDVLKDRLYIEKSDGHSRRSAQTVMYHILDAITKLMAPIVSFLAEEVSDFYQADKDRSIHLQDFPEQFDVWKKIQRQNMPAYKSSLLAQQVKDPENFMFSMRMNSWFGLLEKMRPELLKVIEGQREKGIIKHSLEAKVKVYLDKSDDDAKSFELFISFLRTSQSDRDALRFCKDFIIVSQFEFVDKPDGLEKTELPWLFVGVERADGKKCPRCWQWDKTEHPDELCRRCVGVLGSD